MNKIYTAIINDGFIKDTSTSGEYIKGDWTIRFDDEIIEIYNSADDGFGKYFKTTTDQIDIELVLSEINN